jgi:SAM-dependent methyltransferase
MAGEAFQPIPVAPPSANPAAFALRCLVDLQLGTIVEHLRPAMAALPPGAILDVGAGQSPWREWLPAHCRYVGLDVAHAGDFGMAGSGDVVTYDGGVMPFADASFDGALCIEVLEHAAEPEALLAEIARVLKDGAPLLMTTPWSARRHHIPHDYHRFTRERLAILLQAGGFEHVEVRERGDDVGTAANKMIVLTLGALSRTRGLNALATLPLAAVFAIGAAVMLAAAHLPRGLHLGSDADPLGYFCRATRAPRRPS